MLCTHRTDGVVFSSLEIPDVGEGGAPLQVVPW